MPIIPLVSFLLSATLTTMFSLPTQTIGERERERGWRDAIRSLNGERKVRKVLHGNTVKNKNISHKNH